MSSKAAYKVHKVFYPQGFVATFKSLVTFVSKEDLCSFVSLCLKKTPYLRVSVFKLSIRRRHSFAIIASTAALSPSGFFPPAVAKCG